MLTAISPTASGTQSTPTLPPDDPASLLQETTQEGPGDPSSEVSGNIIQPSASPEPTQAPLSEAPPVIPLAHKTLQLNVNGHSLELPLEKNNAVFDVATLNTEHPASFELVTDDDTLKVMLDSKTAQANEKTEIAIDRIAYNEYIPVTVTDGQDIRTLFIRTLNSSIPKLSAAGESQTDGHYYLSFTTLPLILKLNGAGEIVYYNYVEKELPAQPESEEADPYFGVGLWDFQKHILEDGSVRYSYFEQDPAYNKLALRGFAAGSHVVLDENYMEIDRVYMTDGDGDANAVEGHDFIMLADGHYIISNYELTLVDNIPANLVPNPQGSKVVAAHLREVKDGKALLDWYSTDYPALYALSEEGYHDFANSESQQPDYAHFSSMAIDPKDGNLVCSFRNMSTILKIDRETGDIVWMLSGRGDQFGMTAAQKTSGQSTVRYAEDGSLVIFDNGRATGQTRILRLTLDERAMAVERFEEFEIEGRYTEFGGNADNISGDVFCIGWGMFEGEAAALTEIDFESNKKLFELTLPEGVYTFRCAKFE
ncbi:MAG TPA: hypothetical protein DEB31_10940 [Clostridiales bacterium]|nr:hypothetical protein [Clostridiales bacterium]